MGILTSLIKPIFPSLVVLTTALAATVAVSPADAVTLHKNYQEYFGSVQGKILGVIDYRQFAPDVTAGFFPRYLNPVPVGDFGSNGAFLSGGGLVFYDQTFLPSIGAPIPKKLARTTSSSGVVWDISLPNGVTTFFTQIAAIAGVSNLGMFSEPISGKPFHPFQIDIYSDGQVETFNFEQISSSFSGLAGFASDSPISRVTIKSAGNNSTATFISDVFGFGQLKTSTSSDPKSVPEPVSTLSLVMLGALGAGAIHKRKQRTAR